MRCRRCATSTAFHSSHWSRGLRVSGDLATPWRTGGFGLAFWVFSALQQVYAARLTFVVRASFHLIGVSSLTV